LARSENGEKEREKENVETEKGEENGNEKDDNRCGKNDSTAHSFYPLKVSKFYSYSLIFRALQM